MLDVLDTTEKVQHFFGTENDRQRVRFLWTRKDLIQTPILVKRRSIAYSGEVNQAFRSKSSSDSGAKRPEVGAKRRWSEYDGVSVPREKKLEPDFARNTGLFSAIQVRRSV